MKTKHIPVLITLVAGLTTCIIGIMMQMETNRFMKTLVVVLISFYILGCIAKLVLDKNFKEEPEEEATEEAGEESDAQEGESSEEAAEDFAEDFTQK